PTKTKNAKSKSVKASTTARASSRRTAEYARAASSGARPGPQAEGAVRASRGTALRSGGVTA
ncbi:MAG: SET domain-containing protein-lysine N-methyltransferase, partial [Afipia sp.]|nr:SET domain-containing protein-lysine N-methyltransferase [Afipia sp.]